jgi:hypothetical protein
MLQMLEMSALKTIKCSEYREFRNLNAALALVILSLFNLGSQRLGQKRFIDPLVFLYISKRSYRIHTAKFDQ